MRRVAAGIGGVLAWLALVACGGDSPDPRLPAGADPNNPYTILPVDQLELISYAEEILRDECMADKGFPQLAGTEPRQLESRLVEILQPPYLTDDEAVVRSRGFGPGDQPAQPAKIVSSDPAFAAALEDCRARGREELGASLDHEVAEVVNSFSHRLADALDQVWREHRGLVVECLEGRGFPVVDERALEAGGLPEAFGVELGTHEGTEPAWAPDENVQGVQVGPEVPARKYLPSQRESELAVALLRCKRETQFGEFERAAGLAAQRQAVEDNAAALSELLPRLEEAARRAAVVSAG